MITADTITDERLVELRALDLPRMTAAVCFTSTADTDQGRADAVIALAAWDVYLARFCKAQRNCVCCGADMLGVSICSGIAFGGAFAWGIAHGEGHCTSCRYPARAFHDLGEHGKVSSLVLQYHPSEILNARTTTTDTRESE